MRHLKETDVFTVDGVLTVEEAERIVEAAESTGFEHQSSRGPAFGEVHIPLDQSLQQIHADSLWLLMCVLKLLRQARWVVILFESLRRLSETTAGFHWRTGPTQITCGEPRDYKQYFEVFKWKEENRSDSIPTSEYTGEHPSKSQSVTVCTEIPIT